MERITNDVSNDSWILKYSNPWAPEILKKLRLTIVKYLLRYKINRNSPPTRIPGRKYGGEAIRQSYINHLLLLGAPIQAVAKLVGHESIASTAKYAAPLSINDLRCLQPQLSRLSYILPFGEKSVEL